MRRAGKLFDWPRVLKSCFNAYVLSSLEQCASVWMLSAESHLGLLDSSVRSAERLCEGKLCCLRHRRRVSALCLLYKIYHSGDHTISEYPRHVVAARNTKTSAALGQLVLVIRAAELINLVDRFCLLLRVCGTCCRRACLVATP